MGRVTQDKIDTLQQDNAGLNIEVRKRNEEIDRLRAELNHKGLSEQAMAAALDFCVAQDLYRDTLSGAILAILNYAHDTEERVRELTDDNEHLTLLAARLGLVVRGDVDSDVANDAWRSLPDHLQDAIDDALNSVKWE